MMIIAGFCVAIILTLLGGMSAHALNASDPKYQPPSTKTAYIWGADYCAAHNSTDPGVGDMIWFTAMDGSSNFTVTSGTQYVDVLVQAAGQYCGGHRYNTQVSGDYTDSTYGFRISGNIGYPQAYANQTYYTTQQGQLDVSGLGTGSYKICLTVTTLYPGLGHDPSPNACTTINLTVVTPWSTSGQSQVGVNHDPNVFSWAAKPGDMVYWRHSVTNNGSGSTSSLSFEIDKKGFSNGWNNITDPRGSFSLSSGATIQMGYFNPQAPTPRGYAPPPKGYNWQWANYASYQVVQADVGNTLCQSVAWSPQSNTGGSGASSAACVNVPYNFSLTPSINSSIAGAAVEPGSSLSNVVGTVANGGPTKSYNNTQWQLGKFVLAPGKATVNGTTGTAAPCDYVSSQGGSGCTTLKSGAGPDANGSFYPPSRSFAADPYKVEDLPLGAHICFIMSVNQYDTSHGGANQWRYGTPVCVVVGKKPKLQVLGGDVATRGAIDVSLTQKQVNGSSAVFGSWVEYGVFAVKQDSLLASGAGLSTTPTPATNANQSGWSGLTFANVDGNGNPGSYGNYGAMRSIPAIDQYFAAMGNTAPYQASGNLVANSFATGSPVQVRTAVDLTLGNDKLPAGKSVVIVASGTVTINGDLTYDDNSGKLKSMTDIPQLVIIAKNIAITSGASNVDAWLIARNGYIDTCSDVTQGSMPPNGTGLTGSVCNAPLTVHGPVVASQLLLKRTGGSGTGPVDSGAPAEVFDLRGDSYLWAQLVAGGAGKAQTVYTTELPPRF